MTLRHLPAAIERAQWVASSFNALRSFDVSTWRTRFGELDIIVGIPTLQRGRLARYSDLAKRAEAKVAFGVSILVADLSDIIESKQALARDPVLVALPELHRLRDQRRHRKSEEEATE